MVSVAAVKPFRVMVEVVRSRGFWVASQPILQNGNRLHRCVRCKKRPDAKGAEASPQWSRSESLDRCTDTGTFEVIVASLRREGAVDCIEQACHFDFTPDSFAVVGILSVPIQRQAFGYFSHYEDAMQMLEAALGALVRRIRCSAGRWPPQLRRTLPRSPRRSPESRPLQRAKIFVAIKSLKKPN